MRKIFVYYVLFCSLALFHSCTPVNTSDELELNPNGEYAIPLVNTSATILDISENTSDNARVRVDPDGKLTVLYSAMPQGRNAREIFEPVEFSLPLFILDSLFALPLPVENFPDAWVLNRAELSDVKIKWVMASALEEDITVDIKIPELSVGGEIYQEQFIIPAGENSINTEWKDVSGWSVVLSDNEMNVNYDARRPNGERILLDQLTFQFDRLDFSYIEGFFGREVQEIMGNVITVGAFSNWLSGGLWFEQPEVTIRLENSFGFPVKAQFNEVRFTTVEDNVWQMQGEFITNGVDFEYPSLSEVGVVKYDTFRFTKENSNIQEIFNEKVSEVFFDIDAIGNPEDDPNIIGFMTEDSYYQVYTDVEMPLFLYANDLLLTDTFALDFEGYDDISSAEFKLIMENEFPFDIEVQMFFQEQGIVSDSLFTERYFLPAAEVDSEGVAVSDGQKTAFIDFDQARFTNVVNADEVIFLVKLVSLNNTEVPLWIYEDYDLDLRLGAKLRFSQQ